MMTFKKFPLMVGRCYKEVKEFESIILKKNPPNDRKTIWICGESDCGKSLLARYLGNEKLRENNMEKMEPVIGLQGLIPLFQLL
jgi:polynucleotide 5'-kinase involved in rRNA processing